MKFSRTGSLSSYMWNATQNQTFLTAAEESGSFLIDHIGIATFGNGKSGVNATAIGTDCTTDVYGETDLQIMQAGVFIEGLAVLPEDTEIHGESVKSWYVGGGFFERSYIFQRK